MEETTLAIKFSGTALILLIIGIVICFLASLGYNTYINIKKKIEVRTHNSNNNTNFLPNDYE